MALRRIAGATAGNYLKVTDVHIFTETGVTVTGANGNEQVNRLTANVTYNIYRSRESRINGPADEFETIKTDSRGFDVFPDPAEGFSGTAWAKAISTGYVLLKTLEEFGGSEWEDC